MLDLSKRDPAAVSEAGFEFTVVMPDGTETEAKIKVRGAHSPIVKAHAKKVFTELQTKEAMAKKRGKDVEPMTLDELEEMAIRNAVVRVISWSGLGEDGKEIAFSKDEAARVFKAYPFIREQVTEQSEDITNFRFD